MPILLEAAPGFEPGIRDLQSSKVTILSFALACAQVRQPTLPIEFLATACYSALRGNAMAFAPRCSPSAPRISESQVLLGSK